MRKFARWLLIPISLFADETDLPVAAPSSPQYPIPWFTGPLEAPSGNIVPGGHYNLEPYINLYVYSYSYGNDWKTEKIENLWSLNPELLIEIGINQWMDFQCAPSWFWNYRDGSAHWEIGDFVAQFDFQLYQDQFPSTSWLPTVRLTIKETFPIGRYRRLIPQNKRTDIGGYGSWVTGFNVVFSKLLHMYETHFLNTRLSLECNVSAPVHVKGFNTYGGGYGTHGTVYPGLNYQVDAGFEYNLTRNWALALDVIGIWSGSTRFRGTPGIALDGSVASNSWQASSQYSLAPALEYNWSENLGLIGGSWFTIAGKNSLQFSSVIIALNYYH